MTKTRLPELDCKHFFFFYRFSADVICFSCTEQTFTAPNPFTAPVQTPPPLPHAYISSLKTLNICASEEIRLPKKTLAQKIPPEARLELAALRFRLQSKIKVSRANQLCHPGFT